MSIDKRLTELENATQGPDPKGWPRSIKVVWFDEDDNICEEVRQLTKEEYEAQYKPGQTISVNWGNFGGIDDNN